MSIKTGRWKPSELPFHDIPKPPHHDELWEMVQYIDTEMQRVTGIDLARPGKDMSALVTMDLVEIEEQMRMRVIDSITFDSLPYIEGYGSAYVTYDDHPVPENPNPRSVYHTQPIPETNPFLRPVSAPSEAKRAKLRAKRKKRK